MKVNIVLLSVVLTFITYKKVNSAILSFTKHLAHWVSTRRDRVEGENFTEEREKFFGQVETMKKEII